MSNHFWIRDKAADALWDVSHTFPDVADEIKRIAQQRLPYEPADSIRKKLTALAKP